MEYNEVDSKGRRYRRIGATIYYEPALVLTGGKTYTESIYKQQLLKAKEEAETRDEKEDTK